MGGAGSPTEVFLRKPVPVLQLRWHLPYCDIGPTVISTCFAYIRQRKSCEPRTQMGHSGLVGYLMAMFTDIDTERWATELYIQ